MRSWVCLDSGATVTIVPVSWITLDKVYIGEDNPCLLSWGDGRTSSVVVKGLVEFWIGALHFRMHAWGVPDVDTALLSARQLADAGAAVHFGPGPDGNYIDMTGLNGGRVRIGADSMVSVRVSVDPTQCHARALAAVAATSAAVEAAEVAERAVAAAAVAATAADVAVAQAARAADAAVGYGRAAGDSSRHCQGNRPAGGRDDCAC
jgi:hypothetical protein